MQGPAAGVAAPEGDRSEPRIAPRRASRWGLYLGSFAARDRARLDVFGGTASGVFVVVPLLLGWMLGELGDGLLGMLGALYLLLATAQPPPHTRLRILAAACGTNAAAFTLGTLVALAGPWVLPLVGAGVFVALSAGQLAPRDQIGTSGAILFVVGVGIGGASFGAAAIRGEFAFLGGVEALLGIVAMRLLFPRVFGSLRVPPIVEIPSGDASGETKAFVHELAVAIAVTAGLATAQGLGLLRDYWTMLTIIVSLRATLGSTVSIASMRIIGTVAGALVALVISLLTGNLFILMASLVLFAATMLAVRWVNYLLFTLFLTPFIIVLLNLLVPGSQALAVVRVIDTIIGGGVALLTAFLLQLGASRWPGRRGRRWDSTA